MPSGGQIWRPRVLFLLTYLLISGRVFRHRILGRIFRAGYLGPGISGRAFQAGYFGPGISGRVFRTGYFGLGILGRAFRAGHFARAFWELGFKFNFTAL